MSYHPLWPDFTLRHDDPAALAVPTQELLKIIRALMTLNQTGTCTAFYEYYAHVGIFEITLFEGRWNYRKKPIARYNIDCRNDPLLDEDKETRPISDGFRKNNVNYWAFREIRSIIPHL